MLIVCFEWVVELGVVSVGGFTVWATCWLCTVFCRFVRFRARFCSAISVAPAMHFFTIGFRVFVV